MTEAIRTVKVISAMDPAVRVVVEVVARVGDLPAAEAEAEAAAEEREEDTEEADLLAREVTEEADLAARDEADQADLEATDEAEAEAEEREEDTEEADLLAREVTEEADAERESDLAILRTVVVSGVFFVVVVVAVGICSGVGSGGKV